MIKVKWDVGSATSRGSENRGPTPYVRGIIYAATVAAVEHLVGKRCILWCEGDMEPETYSGKLQEILADFRDNVQVVGSSQESIVLSNVEVLAEITGEEALADRLAISIAQAQNLQQRGPRAVVRNVQTGNVTAATEAGRILDEAVGQDPGAARQAAAAMLTATGVDDKTALGLGEAILMAGAATSGLPTATRPAAQGPLVAGQPGYHMPGNAVVGGVEHEGQTVYPAQPGVERAQAPVPPTMGTIGGAFTTTAPGGHLTPGVQESNLGQSQGPERATANPSLVGNPPADIGEAGAASPI